MRLPFLLTLLVLLPVKGDRGAAIYREHCASCHGTQGQGVAEEYDEALVGKKSVPSLAKYIHRTMPEDDEDAVVDEDAKLVAAYIHESFYSAEARSRIKPPRRDLLRRSRHQHRRALTDLIQSFTWRPRLDDTPGLQGHYFNKEKMNNRKRPLAERIDSVIAFDSTTDHGIKKLNPKAHSIFWSGSLMPPETGTYHFRVHSPNGFRFFLNQANQKKNPFIDAWVSSANKMRTVEASAFLMGAHPVPIFLEYVSYQEKVSSIVLEWKPPRGSWQSIPARHLSSARSPEALLISTPFPPDDSSLGYERGSSISKAWKEASAHAAIEAAVAIHDHLDALARTKSGDPKRGAKLKRFCADFAARAFGRPLSDEQNKRYLDDLFAAAGSDHDTAVKRSLMLVLTSPWFLYPSLNRDPDGQNDSHSNASHLALALWDSVPDKALEKAASLDQLRTGAQIENQVRRMIQDPRTQIKIRRFFHHWLGLAEKNDLTKDSALFPGFDQAAIADLRTSLDLFLDEVVWSDPSDYRQLFAGDKLHLNARLAKLYHAKVPASPGFHLVSVPGDKRAGLLTHPYLLSALSYHHETSPIHRGVFLGRNVLGRFLKPPPEAIEFKDSDFKPHLTMRQKVTEITKDESCMACHAIINPVGFSLENFDAIGRFRTRDKNKPIDTTSTYPTPDDRSVKIKEPRDLAQLAITSPVAHRAFITQLFHHLIQQPVNAYGPDTLDQLHQSFTQSNFNIQKLITAIVTQTVPQNSQGNPTRMR